MKNSNLRVWSCKIGPIENPDMPGNPWADAPMRNAVSQTFYAVTGTTAKACFSNWSDTFNAFQLAELENKLPNLADILIDQIFNLEEISNYGFSQETKNRLGEIILELKKLALKEKLIS